MNTDEMSNLVSILRGCSFRYSKETQLHLGIEQALIAAGLTPEPEVKIKGGRIDFIVGRVGIEVKIKGTVADLTAQLIRYSVEPRLDGLLVVTTRARHRTVPTELNGKPVQVHLSGGVR